MEVIGTDEFAAWYGELSDEDSGAVNRVVDLLAQKGVALPFPYSSKIKNAKHGMRELRIQSGGKPIRVFYFFDEARDAVCLIGGDKTGRENFYEEMTTLAERIAKDYIAEQKAKKAEQEAKKPPK